MPLYEYECEADNGRRVDFIHKFSDEPLTVCPSCGGKVRRLISSPAIQFKGSGWYITDYAKKSGTDAGKDAKGTSSSSSSTESSTTASTPASTPAPAAPTPAKKD
jgi:putative FmdB family regulatory protein